MRIIINSMLLLSIFACKAEKKEIVTYYTTGEVQVVAPIDIDSLAHGLVRYFYKNRALKAEYFYEHGKMNGKYIKFYRSGNLEVNGNYKDGLKSGIITYYYDNQDNTIEQVAKYYKGKEYGPYYYNREDGSLSSEGYVENDTTRFYVKYNEDRKVRQFYSENAIFPDKQYISTQKDFSIDFKVFGIDEKIVDVKYFLVNFIEGDTLVNKILENYKFNKNYKLKFQGLPEGSYFLDFHIPILDTLVIDTKAIEVWG